MLRLFKSFSVYTIANFVEQGIGFILLPIFTFYLTPEDYGILALFTVYVSILTKIISFGSNSLVSIEFFKIEKEEFSRYFTSSFVVPVLVFLLSLIIALFFKNEIASLLSIPSNWVIAIPIISLFNVTFQLRQAYFRVNDWSFKFVSSNLGNVVMNLVLSLTLVVIYKMNWEGRAWGIMVSGFVFTILSVTTFLKYRLLVTGFLKKYIREVFVLGGPIILHALGGFVINFSDKIFIEKLVSTHELGIYNVGYKIGSLIFVFTSSFILAFSPYVHKSLKEATKGIKVHLVKVSWLYVFVLVAMVGVLILLTQPVFNLVIDKAFADGALYVPWVALGYLFHGFYSIFVIYIFFLKKTYILSILSFLNVIVNLVLNYFLIGKYGAMGAAYATVISYATFFIVVSIVSSRLYPMPWFYFTKNQ